MANLELGFPSAAIKFLIASQLKIINEIKLVE